MISSIFSCRYYNYESSLRDCLHQNWQVKLKKGNPLASGEFRNVTLHDKVDILYSLCMYRLDADDVNDSVKVRHYHMLFGGLYFIHSSVYYTEACVIYEGSMFYGYSISFVDTALLIDCEG